MARGVEYEVLHAEIDRDGYDVVLEAGRAMRHTQLKVTTAGGARSVITVNQRLAAKPSGCIVWLIFDPLTRDFTSIRWYGNRPGAPLPDAGSKVARHSRANSKGYKNHRAEHRVLRASRFEELTSVGHLADKLFGRLPAEPLAFLQSRLTSEFAFAPAWADAVAAGDFGAIPQDLCWTDSGPLAHLINGYRLLELISDDEPAAFLEAQRVAQHAAGRWSGDVVTLWTTLFLEARAEHFGELDPSWQPQLDQLCQQLRTEIVALSADHA
jgi:hypothetical protein